MNKLNNTEKLMIPSSIYGNYSVNDEFAEGFSAYVSYLNNNALFLKEFFILMNDVGLYEFKNSIIGG